MRDSLQRLRRLRLNPRLRGLRRETRIVPGDLIMPIFVHDGISGSREIATLPGILQFDVHGAVGEIQRCQNLGIGGVLLFGIPSLRDWEGSGARAEEGVIQRVLQLKLLQ